MVMGAPGASQWRHSSLGYLPYQAMCFLLAAQAVARGMDRKALRAMGARLETNQRGSFLDAAAMLAKQPLLRGLLGLTGPEGAPVPARTPAAPQHAAPAEAPEGDAPLAGDPPLSRAHPVFRYREHAECGGVIRGRIKNRDQRLAAEEALPEG